MAVEYSWLQKNVLNIIAGGVSLNDETSGGNDSSKETSSPSKKDEPLLSSSQLTTTSDVQGTKSKEDEFYEKLRKHIKGNEGFKTTAAWDVANWRIGYGTSTVALNGSLKGNDRLNPKNYIKFQDDTPTKYPVYVDLDTGKQVFYILNPGHVEKYATAKLNNGVIWRIENSSKDPLRGTQLLAENGKKYAHGNGSNNPGIWGYTEKHAQQAFEYDVRKKGGFESKVSQWSPSGYKKLTDEAKIALIDLAYNYGSIVFTSVREAIKSGNSGQVALALAVRVGIQAKNKRFWKEAKYVDPNIFFKLTPEQQKKAKELGYK
jgi:GH24 family phage-related lysozyme (muramidase)